jgi:hypothetical protein
MGRNLQTALKQFARANQHREDALKKLALVASAATALVCAASLIATAPADAKKHHKKPAAAAAGQTTAAPDYGGYNAGPRHDLGGPMRSGDQCWADKDPASNTGQGYWKPCPK